MKSRFDCWSVDLASAFIVNAETANITTVESVTQVQVAKAALGELVPLAAAFRCRGRLKGRVQYVWVNEDGIVVGLASAEDPQSIDVDASDGKAANLRLINLRLPDKAGTYDLKLVYLPDTAGRDAPVESWKQGTAYRPLTVKVVDEQPSVLS